MCLLTSSNTSEMKYLFVVVNHSDKAVGQILNLIQTRLFCCPKRGLME